MIAILNSKVMSQHTIDGVTFLKFNIFNKYKNINHAVSTRHGGVSELENLKTLNLGFSTKDSPENVTENYRRFCNAAGFDVNKLVFAKQTHTANVKEVTQDDWGKGIFKERDYTDIDALVTNVPGTGLVIHTADCVPVTFFDTKNTAVANAHCGWRGTYGELAKATLNKMTELYGTNPKDVACAIGPCICKSCYEVSDDLYLSFYEKFGFDEGIIHQNKKYYLDLGAINRHILIKAGVPDNNIEVCDLCTCCNKDDLFSHRGLGPQRGLLSGIIKIME